MEPDAGLVQEIQSARLEAKSRWQRAAPRGTIVFRRPKSAGRLSEPIAVATRFGHSFDLPEHPHKGNAETDDDAQKHKGQGRGCEHGEHPKQKASGVPADGIKKDGLGAGYTKAVQIFAAASVSTLFDQHSNHRMVSCIQSAAYLDRANAPAVGRADAPLHDVATAVVVVRIVVSIVRIIIIVVIISVGSIESVA